MNSNVKLQNCNKKDIFIIINIHKEEKNIFNKYYFMIVSFSSHHSHREVYGCELNAVIINVDQNNEHSTVKLNDSQ